MNNIYFNWVIILIGFILWHPVVGQDTAHKKETEKLDIFPAISYSPETKLTLGVIGIKYFDFSRDRSKALVSNVEFLGIYTLNKQILIETRWELFGPSNQWRSRGEAFFNRYPDRNYGIGNTAKALMGRSNAKEAPDTLNYLFFDSDRLKFSPAVLYQVKPNLYAGLQYDMEYVYRMKVAEDNFFISADSSSIQQLPVDGLRSGIGFQILFDNRDRILNPIKGTMIEINNLNYTRWLGSDYRFNLFSLDTRYYINTFKNQTLALRTYGSMEFTNDRIPMRALSRVGGHKFIRGYFKGTYQDYHMVAFEAEYRLPFWKEGSDARLWQVWKRLGVVGFVGGAQVMHSLSEFRFDRFNLAAGGGLRVLFNPLSRVTLRFDYAVGLRKDSDGPGKRQSGFYFFLGEAF